MRAKSFSHYALSPGLSSDGAYTVARLIDRVSWKFDLDYKDDFMDTGDVQVNADDTPQFPQRYVEAASRELQSLSWLSFQRSRSDERPIRDLAVLAFLPNLNSLTIQNNEVSDIRALSGCTKLRSLTLSDNPIADLSPIAKCLELKSLTLSNNPVADLSPLANCLNLEVLEVGNIPVKDLAVLESLPNLRELTVSHDLFEEFLKLNKLPQLEKLDLSSRDSFPSFEDFPLMPELRVIRGANMESLNGLDNFPMLENVENLKGSFSSLAPMAGLKKLTHVNIRGSNVQSLEPLSSLPALRDFTLKTSAMELDLEPLYAVPALHDVSIKCAGVAPQGISKLRAELTSWDLEFKSDVARHTPSLALAVVNQDTFDEFDTKKKFNIDESDSNYGLLSSELGWVDDGVRLALSPDFEEDEDYIIPYTWGGARSFTVMLYSEKAVNSFSSIVLRIQKFLCQAKNDWIIYFQSEDAEYDFIVWIYPDHIMVSEEYADAVITLIKPK